MENNNDVEQSKEKLVAEQVTKVEESLPNVDNKKKVFKLIILSIILVLLFILIGYFIYAKYIKKEETSNVDNPQKIEEPIVDPVEDDEEDERISINYISIEEEKKEFDNPRSVNSVIDDEYGEYYIGNNKKIYYRPEEGKVKVLEDSNNINIKKIYYDDMSGNFLLILNNSGEIFIAKNIDEDKVIFKKYNSELKFSNIYFYDGLPCSECECGFDIVLQGENKKYKIDDLYGDNESLTLNEFNENDFLTSSATAPSCRSQYKFQINMAMNGDLKYYTEEDTNETSKYLLNSETNNKIIGSSLIYVRHNDSKEDFAYIVDKNNNLFEIADYKTSYTKIGVVKSITHKGEYSNWPNKLTIILTDGTKIELDEGETEE